MPPPLARAHGQTVSGAEPGAGSADPSLSRRRQCRMGPDPDSVVAPNLAVRGVDGLFVADASIMPRIVSANTNAMAMLIGAQAARLIGG